MQNNNKKDYSKENFLRNGNKTQGQYGKSSFNTTIEQPGIISGKFTCPKLPELCILEIYREGRCDQACSSDSA